MSWISRLFSRRRIYGDLSAEIEEHLNEKIDELVASGMSRAEATRTARREFGNVTLVEECSREIWQWPAIESFFADIRYALRIVRKSPGFTTVAVMTLALGIGANTAIFSLLDALVLRDLPVPHAEQLVQFGAHPPGDPFTGLTLPMFEEIARDQNVFSGTFAWWGGSVRNVETNGQLSRASIWGVTGNFYSELGAVPEVGRLLDPSDVSLNSATPAQVAVLGYRFWRRNYGGTKDVIGKTIKIEAVPFTIIGVAREGFNGMSAASECEVTIPLTAEPLISGRTDVQTNLQRRDDLWFDGAGRLRPGVTLDQARAQLESLWPAIRQAVMPIQPTDAQRAYSLVLQLKVESGAAGRSFLRGQFTKPIYVLLAISGVVLLIACVNLASLMLSRTTARSHEFGLRVALGASRRRLAQQMLVESVMLSSAGTLVGFAFAYWVSRALANFFLGQYYDLVPIELNLTPDLRILAFTAAAGILTGILSGLVPGWRATREDPNTTLQLSSRTVGRGTGMFSKGLIVTQVALSLILLAGTGLFIRTLEKLRAVQPGFQTHGIFLVQLFRKPGGYKDLNKVTYYREMTDRVSSLPGVTMAGIINMGLGLGFDWEQTIHVPGKMPGTCKADLGIVMPGSLRALGISLIRGRRFTWRDDDQAPRVAIVSENLAKRMFANGDALGQRIDVATEPEWQNLQIVGIASNARLYDMRNPPQPTVYLPTAQNKDYMGISVLVVETKIAPAAMTGAIRQVVESLGHEYVYSVKTVAEQINHGLLQERMIALLSAFFGALALLLAAIGLYGLMAYNVARRTRELGIRFALGAQRSGILRMVLRETLMLTLIGIAIGLPCAVAATRLIAHMLFGVTAYDPVTLAAVAIALLAVGALAGYLPARRAMRVDPMVALRYE